MCVKLAVNRQITHTYTSNIPVKHRRPLRYAPAMANRRRFPLRDTRLARHIATRTRVRTDGQRRLASTGICCSSTRVRVGARRTGSASTRVDAHTRACGAHVISVIYNANPRGILLSRKRARHKRTQRLCRTTSMCYVQGCRGAHVHSAGVRVGAGAVVRCVHVQSETVWWKRCAPEQRLQSWDERCRHKSENVISRMWARGATHACSILESQASSWRFDIPNVTNTYERGVPQALTHNTHTRRNTHTVPALETSSDAFARTECFEKIASHHNIE